MSFVFGDWLVPKSMQADLLASLGLGLSALGAPSQPVSILDGLAFAPISVEFTLSGSGTPAQAGDRVTVHFVVRTLEGKELANTVKRGMPFTVELEGMGSFWSTALEGVRVGGRSVLRANSSVFFGKAGVLPVVPAETMLEAEMTVLKIVSGSRR